MTARLRVAAVLALAVSPTAPGPLYAARETIPASLSVADAVSIALKANAQIKDAEAGYANSAADLRIASLRTSYSLGITAALQRSRDESDMGNRVFSNVGYSNLLGTEASLNISPLGLGTERGSVGFELTHPLTSGKGKLSQKSDRVLGAATSLTIREKQLFLMRQATVLNVVSAYYRAVLAQERVKVQERALAIAQELARITRRRADEKLIVEFEASQAEIAVAQANDQLNLQREDARAALQNLMITIGVGAGKTPELADKSPPADIEVCSADEAVRRALDNRPELAIQDLQLAEAERELAMTKEDLRTRLDAVTRFSSYTRDTGVISGSLFETGVLVAGLECRLPIDTRITRERQHNAERDLEVLRQTRLYRMDTVAEDVRKAYRRLEAARTSRDIFTQNLQLAEDNLLLAQRMVEEGLGTTRDVLEAQASLTRVEGSRLAALVDIYLAALELKHAMGEDLTTAIGAK